MEDKSQSWWGWRCQQGLFLLEAQREDLFSGLLQILEAAASTQAWPLPHVLLQLFASIITSPVTNSDHSVYLLQGLFWLHQAHLDNLGSSPHFKSPNLQSLTFARSPLHGNITAGSGDSDLDVFGGNYSAHHNYFLYFMQCSGFFILSGFHWLS